MKSSKNSPDRAEQARGGGIICTRGLGDAKEALPGDAEGIIVIGMAKKGIAGKRGSKGYAQDLEAMEAELSSRAARPSALIDTRVIYCGDCLEQLRKLPGQCVDLIYIDPPFNASRNYEVFWGETKEKRAFEDRHASTQAYIDYMRPRFARTDVVNQSPPNGPW